MGPLERSLIRGLGRVAARLDGPLDRARCAHAYAVGVRGVLPSSQIYIVFYLYIEGKKRRGEKRKRRGKKKGEKKEKKITKRKKYS